MPPNPVEFRAELRAWRGKRLQKTAAALLAVSLDTFRNWELGRNKPASVCRNCLERKMKENLEP